MPTRSGHTTAVLASKVIGTPVFAACGGKLGHVQDLMLDKLANRLVLAVIAVGFSPGMGQRCSPVPWRLLTYDPARQGFVVGLTVAQFRNAPVFGLEELTVRDGERVRDLAGMFYDTI